MLTDTDRAILDLARGLWRSQGAREAAIREQLGISPARYYQRLNALIDRADAMAHDAVLVKRLRRLRDTRRAARSGDRSTMRG